ncbi:MAG: phosphate/phosphite/phosphonate ABC transporter substrate-binding protein, partial [Pseudomonadota bacterium]
MACAAIIAVLLIGPLREAVAQENPVPIHIGVLAFRGNDHALQRWSPTVNYLNKTFHDYHFDLLPMNISAMNRAAAANALHYTLTNPGHYVELEARYGASRIATLKNIQNGAPLAQFGAVIFTRADRNDIQTLDDLRGRRFAAVGTSAFGGFQMAWREMNQHGITSLKKLQLITLGFPQDNVVRAVLNNRADAGSVRTGVLESMAMWEQIDLQDIKVLNPVVNDFPFLLSTQLYPEWAFAQMPNAPADLSEKIAIALLSMSPDNAAAKTGQYAGWTIPLDYSPVHALLRELRAPPYE